MDTNTKTRSTWKAAKCVDVQPVRRSTEGVLEVRDFVGIGGETMGSLWRVYVWVARRRDCYQPRREELIRSLLINRLNELPTVYLGRYRNTGIDLLYRVKHLK